jgi:hypothetical protein
VDEYDLLDLELIEQGLFVLNAISEIFAAVGKASTSLWKLLKTKNKPTLGFKSSFEN